MGRFSALAAALAAMMFFGLTERAVATGFCSCCESNLTQSCGKVCAAISLAPGMCPAIVDHEGTGAAAEGANALNDMSLRDIVLGEPTSWQLELFRRFVEKSRRQAIRSYEKAMRALRRHRINEADFKKADALYKEALVNYYHGIRAYLNRVGTKSD